MSAMLLFYTAIIAPVQICFWNYDDPCNKFPTLYFDVYVDSFFVVRAWGLKSTRLLESVGLGKPTKERLACWMCGWMARTHARTHELSVIRSFECKQTLLPL